jgi:phage tail sheath gpL-like
MTFLGTTSTYSLLATHTAASENNYCIDQAGVVYGKAPAGTWATASAAGCAGGAAIGG